jgi:hypothetical protein
VGSYTRQTDAFRRGAALLGMPPEIVQIPYEDTTLPGYFFRAGEGQWPRATVILTGGYDGTAEELDFFNGAAALARGYHVLAFDGPGQGTALLRQGLVLRPDWENVVTLAACGGGTPATVLRRVLRILERKPTAGWALRRGQQVHGAADPIQYLRSLRDYSLKTALTRSPVRCSSATPKVTTSASRHPNSPPHSHARRNSSLSAHPRLQAITAKREHALSITHDHWDGSIAPCARTDCCCRVPAVWSPARPRCGCGKRPR